MNQLSSITPLEIILIGFAAAGVFLFFRACWRNIKRSRRHLGLALLTLMMSLTAQTAQANDAVTYIDMDGKTQANIKKNAVQWEIFTKYLDGKGKLR